MNKSDYKFLPLDGEGNLINVASRDNIKEPWDKPITRLIDTYRQHVADNLRALYIHGSVVRGTAVEYTSDIDVFALVSERHENDQAWVRPELKSIRQDYPFVAKIDYDMGTEGEVMNEKLDTQTIIKTLALCVWGEDISPKIPRSSSITFPGNMANILGYESRFPRQYSYGYTSLEDRASRLKIFPIFHQVKLPNYF